MIAVAIAVAVAVAAVVVFVAAYARIPLNVIRTSAILSFSAVMDWTLLPLCTSRAAGWSRCSQIVNCLGGVFS